MVSRSSSTPSTGLTARVTQPGTAVLTSQQGERSFTAATTKTAIGDLLRYVAAEVANDGRPIRVETYDEAGDQVPLLVHHDGTVQQAPADLINSSVGGPADDQPASATSEPIAAVATSPAGGGQAAIELASPTQDSPAPSAIRSPATPDIHRPRPAAPKLGVQGLIHRATKVNLGLSKRERTYNQLVARIRTPLPQLHRCAFISLKGGIGKTTSAAGFGHTFAHYRPDSVFVADMNPDAGTLAKRTVGAPLAGVKPLLAAIQAGQVNSLTDLSRYTRAAGRLTVLPGDPDPQAGQAMDADDFRTVMDVVQRYYSLILIDTGDGVTRPITPGILDGVDSVVVAATHSKDGAEAAIETLDWLSGHGYEALANSAVVTLSAKDRVSKEIDKAAVAKILDARAAALITIPPDSHLADAGAIDRDRLAPATRRVLMEGAAAVASHWADIDQYPGH
ncbi:MinD/ParA family ATP-binding protein [Micromonospora sp.]|uniref:MinD/ParA family ATP-binding protein n=1 Tax=Micromonospora sp. TaxID=1876 RepID=UPI003B3A26D9